MSVKQDRAAGALLGMMAGDAIGLPFENMNARRVRAMLARGGLRHRLILRWGMVSDDTEHAVMCVDAWSTSRGDVERFTRRLACLLRLWLLCIPAATGMATARAALRLLLGWSPQRSGVNSAGNGPLMRSLMLGVLCEDDSELARSVRASTIMTHTDERALHGALAIALCARVAVREESVDQLGRAFHEWLPEGEMRTALDAAVESFSRGERTEEFATGLGCERGVSGFVMHTAPVVVHAWLTNRGDCARAIETAVRLGGDTDTTAALVGGLAGAGVGAGGVPREWIDGIIDFPLTPRWATHHAERAASGAGPARVGLRFLSMPLRNLAFLCVVLGHAFRRAFPPY